MTDLLDHFSQKTVAEADFNEVLNLFLFAKHSGEAEGVDGMLIEKSGESTGKLPWSDYREKLQARFEKWSRLRDYLDKVPLKHGSCYLHVCNGGVTVSVEDRGMGATLALRMSSYGNMGVDFAINTNRQALFALGMMLISASKREYTNDGDGAYLSSLEAAEQRDASDVAKGLGFTLEETLESSLPDRDLYDDVVKNVD